jgi:hypothetical protein
MRSSSLIVTLLIAGFADRAAAQCADAATAAAESTCKSENNCDSCSDFNFGTDCASNADEHCAEIACCPACEDEIRAMFACEHASCRDLSCPAPSAFEWAGVFSLDGMTSPSKWSMQAGEDGTYPDQSMKVVIMPVSTPDEETMASLESAANELVAGDCPAVADSGSLTPATGGSCFTLNVGSTPDSEFNIVTVGIAGVAVFAEHVPIEFERTRHYFYDAAGTDIEPIAESAAFEWSGVFSLDGMTSPCKWSMQAGPDGEYPDPSMAVVIIPTDTPDDATMDSLASDAVGLLGLFGTSCIEVADGGMMAPADGGSCYILNVGSGNDSEFDIDTVGIAGVAVYAQHVPVEFERDRHYFYDAVLTDIEPIAESAHDVAHSHGPADTVDQCANPFDYNDDGIVGVDDLLALLANYGRGAVPCSGR